MWTFTIILVSLTGTVITYTPTAVPTEAICNTNRTALITQLNRDTWRTFYIGLCEPSSHYLEVL